MPRPAHKPFKTYEPGYLHVDVKPTLVIPPEMSCSPDWLRDGVWPTQGPTFFEHPNRRVIDCGSISHCRDNADSMHRHPSATDLILLGQVADMPFPACQFSPQRRGRKALARSRLSASDYNLILLDLDLPDMNGMEVLRYLRVARVYTPILILTGLDDTESKLRGFGFGADDYLTKPFNREESRVRGIEVGHFRHTDGKVPALDRWQHFANVGPVR